MTASNADAHSSTVAMCRYGVWHAAPTAAHAYNADELVGRSTSGVRIVAAVVAGFDSGSVIASVDDSVVGTVFGSVVLATVVGAIFVLVTVIATVAVVTADLLAGYVRDSVTGLTLASNHASQACIATRCSDIKLSQRPGHLPLTLLAAVHTAHALHTLSRPQYAPARQFRCLPQENGATAGTVGLGGIGTVGAGVGNSVGGVVVGAEVICAGVGGSVGSDDAGATVGAGVGSEVVESDVIGSDVVASGLLRSNVGAGVDTDLVSSDVVGAMVVIRVWSEVVGAPLV